MFDLKILQVSLAEIMDIHHPNVKERLMIFIVPLAKSVSGRQKGIFLKHLLLHEQNKKYIRNEIVGVKNTDIIDEHRNYKH